VLVPGLPDDVPDSTPGPTITMEPHEGPRWCCRDSQIVVDRCGIVEADHSTAKGPRKSTQCSLLVHVIIQQQQRQHAMCPGRLLQGDDMQTPWMDKHESAGMLPQSRQHP